MPSVTGIKGKTPLAYPTSPGRGDGSSGSALQPFPNRLDVSVNQANVDNAQSAVPVLTTRTGTTAAGSFNGGGQGNKAILGVQGFDGMLLSALLSLEVVWKEMEIAHTNPLALEVYMNLVVEPDPVGAPGVFKIFNIANTNLPIVCFAATSLGGGRWDYVWHSAPPIGPNGPNVVQVVGPDFPNTFPPVVPFIHNAAPWFNQAFTIADILASFPNARLRDANSGDGGLPAGTVTPAIMVIVGDSNNKVLVSRLIEQVKVNGATV